MIAMTLICAVPSKKPQINTVVEDSLKQDFERLCELEQRSMSNMIALLISQAVEEAKKDGKLGDRTKGGK
jgi:hypothetical protein